MLVDKKRLLRIGKIKQNERTLWLEGVSIERDSSVSIGVLQQRVTAARFGLAKEMHKAVRLARKSRLQVYRAIISRSYYCMYHAIRAAAYIHYLGDDYEKHSDLPARVPADFPNQAFWANQLKSAREYRNEADYDPYPRNNKYWAKIAKSVEADAINLLPLVAVYLRGRGCRV